MVKCCDGLPIIQTYIESDVEPEQHVILEPEVLDIYEMLQISDELEGIDKDDELLEGFDKECELLKGVDNEGEKEGRKKGKVVKDVETDCQKNRVEEGEGVECVDNESMEEGEKKGGEGSE